MDPLAFAAICRAENAATNARQYLGGKSPAAIRKTFVEIAATIAKASNKNSALNFLQHSEMETVAKAATAHTTLSEMWQAPEVQELFAGFIASVPEPDLLAAIAKYATELPKVMGRVLIASGASGNVVAEGFPKLVKNIDLSLGGETEFFKSCAAVVVSSELLGVADDAGRRAFETELTNAVVRACNAAALATLVDSGTTQVSAGTDPLASLRTGIRAAGPSAGYVVTAPAADVAELALSEANRGGMAIRGGTFIPGVEIIAQDDASVMTVIPASRLQYWNGGFELRPTGHATVDMSDTPEAAGEKVSLWQTNCFGLLVERYWRISGDTSGVVVVQ